MRPILRTDKFDSSGNPVEYNPWGDAKPELIDEIGDYCSYCEKQLDESSLAIEHIYHKNQYTTQQFHWNNFLLACPICNSIKGIKDVVTRNPFLPHLDNLLCFIEILYGGVISIKTGVTGTDLARTQSFIELIGLDRTIGHPSYSNKDDRWDYRLAAYDLAERQLQKYISTPTTTDIENIVALAVGRGFFTVWFTVFDAHDEVKSALITAFKGTNHTRFDANNHFQPI